MTSRIVFIIAGLGLLLWAYSTFSSQVTFIRQSTKTSGVVVENYIDAEGDGYFPVVEFKTPEGNSIKFRSHVGASPPKFEIGERVEILYDPSDPQNAQINSARDMWIATEVLGTVGSIFFIMGVVSLFSELKNKPLKKRLRK